MFSVKVSVQCSVSVQGRLRRWEEEIVLQVPRQATWPPICILGILPAAWWAWEAGRWYENDGWDWLIVRAELISHTACIWVTHLICSTWYRLNIRDHLHLLPSLHLAALSFVGQVWSLLLCWPPVAPQCRVCWLQQKTRNLSSFLLNNKSFLQYKPWLFLRVNLEIFC